MKKFQWKDALFSYFLKTILPPKRYKIALPVTTVLFEQKVDE
jgi:hypothetical protein